MVPWQAERPASPNSDDSRWGVWHQEALQDGYTESLEDFVGREGGDERGGSLAVVVFISAAHYCLRLVV